MKRMRTTDLRAPDGTRAGDPIPGSRWLREFCCLCGEPMRVTRDRVGHDNFCEDCEPPPQRSHCGNPHTHTLGLDKDPDAYGW